MDQTSVVSLGGQQGIFFGGGGRQGSLGLQLCSYNVNIPQRPPGTDQGGAGVEGEGLHSCFSACGLNLELVEAALRKRWGFPPSPAAVFWQLSALRKHFLL